jgi:hypothetical protein
VSIGEWDFDQRDYLITIFESLTKHDLLSDEQIKKIAQMPKNPLMIKRLLTQTV